MRHAVALGDPLKRHFKGHIDTRTDIDVEMDIDSDMAVSTNPVVLLKGVIGLLLGNFGVDILCCRAEVNQESREPSQPGILQLMDAAAARGL